VYFPDGATVHPARLVRALRRAVVDAGVAIYERTPALRVHSGSPNVIETLLARMKATDVVLAVNAVLTGWRPAARRLTNFGS
jgi:glycine/D-amino acid oxidase-like deaminating enzyme